MKPILAFDLDGTIISSKAADEAHKQWFKVMGMLLGDSSVESLAGKRDYFPDVLNVMQRLTGLNLNDSMNKDALVKYARNLYQMIYLAEIRKEGKNSLFPDVLDMIIDLKQKCRVALITTAPEDMVLPALEILGIKKLFDYIYRSPINKEPSKYDLLNKFTSDVGKPSLYIGNEKKDAEACKMLGIKFGLAKWGKYDEDAAQMAKFVLSTPQQLRGVTELI